MGGKQLPLLVSSEGLGVDRMTLLAELDRLQCALWAAEDELARNEKAHATLLCNDCRETFGE